MYSLHSVNFIVALDLAEQKSDLLAMTILMLLNFL